MSGGLGQCCFWPYPGPTNHCGTSCELLTAVSDPGESVAQQGWKASQLTGHRQTNVFGYLNSQHEWDCTCESCLYLIADVTDFFGTNTTPLSMWVLGWDHIVLSTCFRSTTNKPPKVIISSYNLLPSHSFLLR